MVNLSASDEMTGKADYRRDLVSMQSARLVCAYVYADAGEGESSTDLVFGGHDIIAENGNILAESERFASGMVTTEIDLYRLVNERRRMTTFYETGHADKYTVTGFDIGRITDTVLTRYISMSPFVPGDEAHRADRCSEIITMQAAGLRQRLVATGCETVIIGISGGLDSTLALLVAVRAFDMAGLDRQGIVAVTMPCFGTTKRTHDNACALSESLGVSFREINIRKAVEQHFSDIGHDPSVMDVTYENIQARQRTYVLMNLANELSGMVIGTGDLSEIALGWATYCGDHMSMYGVNASVPKTLIRYLVRYVADHSDDSTKAVLMDILDTPVSPELLPPKDGEISQKTEELVGPYELHDFFLYHMMRYGYHPGKIYRMAVYAFDGSYDRKTIYTWLRIFYKRFFSQQFKRSCMPDGPKVGSVALSPRGDFRMPSDASVSTWLKELDEIAIE